MAQVSKEEIYEVIDSAGNINEKTEDLIMELTRNDAIAQRLIAQREAAKERGDHNKFADLDAELLATLEVIGNMEREIIGQINPNIDFDVFQDQSKAQFMINENKDIGLENEVLGIRLRNQQAGFEAKYNSLIDEKNRLTNQKDRIQQDIDEMEKSPNPNQTAINRKKKELEEILRQIDEMEKKLEKFVEIAKMFPKGGSKTELQNMIEKNNRIIENNLRNLNFNDIRPENYSKATQIIQNAYVSQREGSGLFPIENSYKGFENIFDPQEFRYVAQEFERANGQALSMNVKQRPGFWYKLIHKGDMENMLKARYPHLAAKGNSKELSNLLREHRNDLAVMMQSGITPDMLRNAYRNIEADIRHYQGNSNRAEWLKEIIVNQEQSRDNQEPQRIHAEPQHESINPEPQAENSEQEQKGKGRQTTLDEFNDPINILSGIEKLGLDSKIVEKMRNSTIYSIGDLIDELNRNGIDLTVTQRQQEQSQEKQEQKNKKHDIFVDKDVDMTHKKHDIFIDDDVSSKPRKTPKKTSKKIEPEVIEFDELPDDPNYTVQQDEEEKPKRTTRTPHTNTGRKPVIDKKARRDMKKAEKESKVEEEIEEVVEEKPKRTTRTPHTDTGRKKHIRIRNNDEKQEIEEPQEQTSGTDVSNIGNKKMEKLLRENGINTVEEYVQKVEQDGQIEGISSDALKKLRGLCNTNNIDNNIKWEKAILDASKAKSSEKMAKKGIDPDKAPKVSKKIAKAVSKREEQKVETREPEIVENDDLDIQINGDDVKIGTVIRANGKQKTIRVDEDRDDR